MLKRDLSNLQSVISLDISQKVEMELSTSKELHRKLSLMVELSFQNLIGLSRCINIVQKKHFKKAKEFANIKRCIVGESINLCNKNVCMQSKLHFANISFYCPRLFLVFSNKFISNCTTGGQIIAMLSQ